MLSDSEFKDLVHLARLDPNDKSLLDLKDDFGRILQYVESIQELELKDVDLDHSQNAPNRTRKDQGVSELSAREIEKFAPQFEAGHFVVPGVLESES